MKVLEACPICASPYTAYVREVFTRRTKKSIALYTCLNCHSFWNPSGYVEDQEQLEKDLQWGLSVAERNQNAANRLFDKLIEAKVKISSVVEIGCGIGTLLTVAQSRGYEAIGYDTNSIAIKHAADVNNLNVHSNFWDSNSDTHKVDLYLSISVLEHIEQPRALIKNLAQAAIKNHAALFCSVPFLEKDKWEYILDPDPLKKGTPFFDNDVHVTHFSVEGLMLALRQAGLNKLELMQVGLWNGVLCRPD